ncbi:hypothetical protein GCM10017771_93370 [Streptomyces capitiformicae]|uniref:Uncharacterized protein n=1 Tax=Streptomyces capitiformicae TaxID=2014920 RepID=A0A918ZV35_9ACTN|nr:hypothetical protein GCM10017771_93370 [Streptomyces capitiformicae]
MSRTGNYIFDCATSGEFPKAPLSACPCGQGVLPSAAARLPADVTSGFGERAVVDAQRHLVAVEIGFAPPRTPGLHGFIGRIARLSSNDRLTTGEQGSILGRRVELW